MKLVNIIKEIEISQYQIYCDLDGVITNFDSRYEFFTGLSPKEADEKFQKEYGKKKGREFFWEKVDYLGSKFWSEMPWMPDGKELWEFLKPYKPTLLSSPSTSQTSVEGKKLWVENQIPGTPLILRQAKDKQEFSAPNHILIDDRADNCQQWRDKGGIAITHKNTKDTIRQLKELGFKDKVNEIKAIPDPQRRVLQNSENFWEFFRQFHWGDEEGKGLNDFLRYWNLFYKGFLKFSKDSNGNISKDALDFFYYEMPYTKILPILISKGVIPKYIPFSKDTISNFIYKKIGVDDYNLELPRYRDLINGIPELKSVLKGLMYRFQIEIIRNGNPVLVDKSNINSISEKELIEFIENTPEVKEIFIEIGRQFLNEDKIKSEISEIISSEWVFSKTFTVESGNITESEFIYILEKNYSYIFSNKLDYLYNDEENDFNEESIQREMEKRGYLTIDESYDLEFYEPYQRLLISSLKNIEGKELNEIKVLSGNIPQFIEATGEEDNTGKEYEIKGDKVVEWLNKTGRVLPNNITNYDAKFYEFLIGWFDNNKLVYQWNDWTFGIREDLNEVNINFYNWLIKNTIKKSDLNEIKVLPNLNLDWNNIYLVNVEFLGGNKNIQKIFDDIYNKKRIAVYKIGNYYMNYYRGECNYCYILLFFPKKYFKEINIVEKVYSDKIKKYYDLYKQNKYKIIQ